MALDTPNKKASLSFTDGTQTLELPIHVGTVGPDVIDIRQLYAKTGKFTYDPGFMSTAACDSRHLHRWRQGYCCIAATVERCNAMRYPTCSSSCTASSRTPVKGAVRQTVTSHTMVPRAMLFFLPAAFARCPPMRCDGLSSAMVVLYPRRSIICMILITRDLAPVSQKCRRLVIDGFNTGGQPYGFA